MPNLKISQLSSATTPLGGTEILPLNQSGVTSSVSVANLTAGRAISAASLTVSTGNVVIGTSGAGIDFSVTSQASGMTSELLTDYEEGTWTPVDGSSGGFGFAAAAGSYVKIGRMIIAEFQVTYPTTSNTNAARVNGLPYSGTVGATRMGAFITYTTYAASSLSALLATTGIIFRVPGGSTVQNSALSGLDVRGVIVYQG